MLLSCNPAPFDDPKPDMEELVSVMTARIDGEEAQKQLEPTEYERKTTHLKRFLAKKAYDADQALYMWKEWVQWRRGMYMQWSGVHVPHMTVGCLLCREPGRQDRRSRDCI